MDKKHRTLTALVNRLGITLDVLPESTMDFIFLDGIGNRNFNLKAYANQKKGREVITFQYSASEAFQKKFPEDKGSELCLKVKIDDFSVKYIAVSSSSPKQRERNLMMIKCLQTKNWNQEALIQSC